MDCQKQSDLGGGTPKHINEDFETLKNSKGNLKRAADFNVEDNRDYSTGIHLNELVMYDASRKAPAVIPHMEKQTTSLENFLGSNSSGIMLLPLGKEYGQWLKSKNLCKRITSGSAYQVYQILVMKVVWHYQGLWNLKKLIHCPGQLPHALSFEQQDWAHQLSTSHYHSKQRRSKMHYPSAKPVYSNPKS